MLNDLSGLVTGVVVSYNTKELLQRSYGSVRKFYPNMKIIIVDGSDELDPCYQYVSSLASQVTIPVQTGYNIGHGRGMCLGIHYAETPFALIFDSDIEVLNPLVKEMLKMMESDTFGIGYIEQVGFDGYHYGVHAHHHKEGWMPYLQPYFQLININNYKKFYPYVHHGAPCYLTMLDIYKRGLSNKILKEFLGPGIISRTGWKHVGIPIEYVRHYEAGGTRKLRSKNGLSEIEGRWELNRGQV